MMSPAPHPPALVIAAPASAAGAGEPRAFAPNLPAGTWASSALPVPFVLALPLGRDVGAEARVELEVAARTWSDVACTSFRAAAALEARTLAAGDDGVNGVFFHDDAWPPELVPGAVAQTVVHLDGAGRYRDADIHLNSASFRFSLDGAPGTQDLRSVLVHELGHALGLGHTADARATMFATGSGLRWRSLEADDVAGVCALYPGTGAGGCTALPCPAPLSCVAGACQRPGAARDVCAPCTRVAGACEAAGDTARCIDIGSGDTAGRVCGRACTSDVACGAGFRCRATTEAGDLQCVADDGCSGAAHPCAVDADCTDAVCRAGACVGAVDPVVPDAGSPTDAGTDAGPGPAAVAAGGGCACSVGPVPSTARAHGRGGWLALLAAVALALVTRARRPR